MSASAARARGPRRGRRGTAPTRNSTAESLRPRRNRGRGRARSLVGASELLLLGGGALLDRRWSVYRRLEIGDPTPIGAGLGVHLDLLERGCRPRHAPPPVRCELIGVISGGRGHAARPRRGGAVPTGTTP